MNATRFAIHLAATQLALARAKQDDYAREHHIKQADEELQELFEILPEGLQTLVLGVAAQLQFPRVQPPATPLEAGPQ